MNLLRSLFAVLLAIAVASPACCCTVVGEAPAEEHRCCGGGAERDDDTGPVEHACACPARMSQQLEDPPQIPTWVTALPAPDTPLRVPKVAAAPLPEKIRPGFRNDTGPPRLRLALYQRFLI